MMKALAPIQYQFYMYVYIYIYIYIYIYTRNLLFFKIDIDRK